MAKTAKQQLKTWFQNLKKPTQEQFWHWLDSYWHKDEKIPQSAIENWDEFLKSLPNDGELKNYLLKDGANINEENREVLRAKLGVRDLPPNLGLVDAEEEGNVYTKAQVDELNQTLQTSLNEIDLTPYYTAQQVDDNFATKDDTHTEFQQMQNAIDKIHLILQTEDVNLDTLQEISDRIKTIAENNDKLSISEVQDLGSALDKIKANLSTKLDKGSYRGTAEDLKILIDHINKALQNKQDQLPTQQNGYAYWDGTHWINKTPETSTGGVSGEAQHDLEYNNDLKG